MARTTKIAFAGAVGGLLIALSVGLTMTSNAPEPPVVHDESIHSGAASDVDLRRCRTLTMPDAGCEAAWDAKRRHFFGRKDER